MTEEICARDAYRTSIHATVVAVDAGRIDWQADGETHVRSTGEVGSVRVVKTESKGKGFKRMRIELAGD